MIQGKTKKRALSRDYLIKATYSYLQRFATTEKNLRLVLDRKVKRRLPETEAEDAYSQAQDWIEDIVQKAVEQKLVDDRQFAEAKAASLLRSGNSKMKISQKLLAKGVEVDMLADVMADLSEQHQDLDFHSAVKYIKKRRFGAFSHRHDGSSLVEKELASVCRAGFSYSLADKILKMPRQELEEILYQNRM